MELEIVGNAHNGSWSLAAFPLSFGAPCLEHEMHVQVLLLRGVFCLIAA